MALFILPLVLALGNVVATKNQLETQTQNQYQLSTGENIQVRINQEQAKEMVRIQLQEQLRIQDCDCEDIQLIETLNNQNELRIAYEISEEFEGKLLGLFMHRIRTQAQIDVETGEVLNIKMPWYFRFMRFS